MRGYVEESDEVKTARGLREAARKFAGYYLLSWADAEKAEQVLLDAAKAYAATQPKPRKKRATL